MKVLIALSLALSLNGWAADENPCSSLREADIQAQNEANRVFNDSLLGERKDLKALMKLVRGMRERIFVFGNLAIKKHNQFLACMGPKLGNIDPEARCPELKARVNTEDGLPVEFSQGGYFINDGTHSNALTCKAISEQSEWFVDLYSPLVPNLWLARFSQKNWIFPNRKLTCHIDGTAADSIPAERSVQISDFIEGMSPIEPRVTVTDTNPRESKGPVLMRFNMLGIEPVTLNYRTVLVPENPNDPKVLQYIFTNGLHLDLNLETGQVAGINFLDQNDVNPDRCLSLGKKPILNPLAEFTERFSIEEITH